MRFFRLFISLIYSIYPHFVCSYEPTGHLDDCQFDIITYSAAFDLFPEGHGKILTLGLLQESILKLRIRFPHIEIDRWEQEINPIGKYDAFIIFLGLEKNGNRNEILKAFHKALKPGKKGVVFCTPKNTFSLDNLTEGYLEISLWKKQISSTPILSITEYKVLCEKIGFLIESERQSVGVIRIDDSINDWICERWEIPESIQASFIIGFNRFLEEKFNNQSILFLDIYRLLLIKDES